MMHFPRYLILFLFVYTYIYNPPFAALPVTPIKILYIIAFLYLTFKKKWNYLINNFKGELFILLLIVIFSLFREVIGGELVFFKNNLFLLIESIILPYFLFLLYNKKLNISFVSFFLIVGFVATLFSVAMICNQTLNDFIRYSVLKTSKYTELVAFRTYGLSQSLTFGYGTVNGIMFALVFLCKKELKYLFLVPFFLIAILFNARIGFVPVIFTIIYLSVFKFGFRFIIKIIVCIILFYVLIIRTDLLIDHGRTVEWGLDFFSQLASFMPRSTLERGTIDVLFGRMFILPETTIAWIFGIGKSIFLRSGSNSDVGYILQLNYGGLFYMGILLSYIMFLFRRLHASRVQYWFKYLFIFTIIVTNIKGNFLAVGPGFKFLMLLYVFYICEKKLKENNIVTS